MSDPANSNRPPSNSPPPSANQQPSGSSSSPIQRRRPNHIDLFSASNDDLDVENPLPSPPYRRDPSRTNLYLGPYAEQSPAYKSRSNVDLYDESSAMVDHKPEHDLDHESDHDDHHGKSTMKTARFDDDVTSPLASAHPIPPFARTDSGFNSVSRSRSPSIVDTDEEDEQYDWSGDEDLVDEEAKFEQNMGVAKKQRWGFRKYIAVLFGSLIGSTVLSGLIVTPALLLHFFWYKPNPTDHRRYVKDNVEAWLFWAAANLLISWYLALCIDIVPVILRFLVALFWGHFSESLKSKTELYVSVKDTIKPVFYAASGWVSWVIIFAHIYKLRDQDDGSKSRAQYTNIVYDVIEFLFFFALVICAQRMLSHAIAFSFHRTAYRERLESVEETVRVVEKLRAYRPKRSHIKATSQGFGSRSFNALNLASAFHTGSRPGTPSHSRGPSRGGTPSRPSSPTGPARPPLSEDGLHQHGTDHEDRDETLVMRTKGKRKDRKSWNTQSPPLADSEPITPQHQPQSGPDSPHQYPPTTTFKFGHRYDENPEDTLHMKHAAKTVAKTVKTAVLHDARNIEGRADSDLSGLTWNVNSSQEAKRLARSIYSAFKRGNRTYLIPSDFYPAFTSEEEAEKAFRVFDKDNNGDLSRAEIKTTVMKVYKERRFLSRSMRDVSVALKTLDQILLIFALIVLFFISLSVFNVSIGDSLTSVYSLGIGLSFVFKNAASNAFDAIMFLFVTHPFDTGDRCFIDDENLVVKKMGLFATVFTRSDGTESYYFNSQLFTKFITNARRSDKTAEAVTIQVHWRTPLAKLDALEQCLNDWLATEKNRWYQPTTSVTLQNIKYMRHLECTIGIGHNSNWQYDWGLRNARRTAFHAAVNYYCRQLGIVAYEASMPITYADPDTQDINSYPGEEDFMDVGFDETASQQPSAQQQPMHAKEVHRPTSLGFQPPPDKPLPGVRARKSKHKKAVLRATGADG